MHGCVCGAVRANNPRACVDTLHSCSAAHTKRQSDSCWNSINKKHSKNVGPIRHCEPFYIAIHQVSLLSHAATVALRIDVHDNDDNDNNNDNVWQRGPLWPHRMGPTTIANVSAWPVKRYQRATQPKSRRTTASTHNPLGVVVSPPSKYVWNTPDYWSPQCLTASHYQYGGYSQHNKSYDSCSECVKQFFVFEGHVYFKVGYFLNVSNIFIFCGFRSSGSWDNWFPSNR